MTDPKCDIIIPVYNRLEMTRNCLKSIADNTASRYRLILIDNGSGLETMAFLEDFKNSKDGVTLVRNQNNIGWVMAVNQGIRLSASSYVCIMNNDTIVKTDDWLDKMIAVADSEADIGLANPSFGLKRDHRFKNPLVEIDFCRGYCMLIKREVIGRIGLLDEAYGLGYYDDDDYSVRAIRAGFRCVRVNGVFVEHIGDSTFSAIFKSDKRLRLHEKNKMLFYSKWGRRLRIVYILTQDTDSEAISRILFSLARKQHIVYLWNVKKPLDLDHINIREKRLPLFFSSIVYLWLLSLNRLKKKAKRYDIVFTDDAWLKPILAMMGPKVYCVDAAKDADKIKKTTDAMSKA